MILITNAHNDHFQFICENFIAHSRYFHSTHDHSPSSPVPCGFGAKVPTIMHTVLCLVGFPDFVNRRFITWQLSNNVSPSKNPGAMFQCVRPLANESKLPTSPSREVCGAVCRNCCVVHAEGTNYLSLIASMHERELVYHVGFRVGMSVDCGCRQSFQASTSRITTSISASVSRHIFVVVLIF